MKLSCVTVLFLILVSLANTENPQMTIHGIAHSHNDAGWLMPFDKYYENYTKLIIDGVIAYLSENEEKVFNWSDIAFFEYWWQRQDQDTQEQVKKLVKQSRFVFVGGGWVMNDEALPAYKESLLQMRTGLTFLRETFDVRPTIGWQIDPFGSSALTVAVLSKLGYDSLVENRMSKNYKDKLAKEDGFNFYWQGHQVSEDPDDNLIFTHVLTDHYNIIKVWNENMVIGSNIPQIEKKIYETEVSPPLTAVQVLNNNHAKINSMVCLGDDFFYVNAPQLFKKFDELLGGLEKEGKNNGMEVKAKYSSLYKYFEGLHDSNTTYGLFKGDFLPYNEPKKDYEDFWTGYYSTRLHLKRFIRFAFNQIQSFKTLFAIDASINDLKARTSTDDNSFDKISELIEGAERDWSILMHHDAITGTHELITEPSYYATLDKALSQLDKALEIFKNIERAQNENQIFLDKLEQISNNKTYSYILVNPSATGRNEIMNMTLPASDEGLEYILILETTEKTEQIDSYITETQEIDEGTFELKPIKKIFFDLHMEKLTTARLYILTTDKKADCDAASTKCATRVTPKTIDSTHKIENDMISLDFNENGSLAAITKKLKEGAQQSIPIEETITYYRTDHGSRSGHYIFNPMTEKVTMNFSSTELYEYQIGDLTTLYQVVMKNNVTMVVKSYSVNQKGCPRLKDQYSFQLEFFSKLIIEASLSLKLSSSGKDAKFTAYVDDSMKLIERPIYDKKVDIKRHNDIELNGFFTYACVHGGALKKSMNSKDLYFGWQNSNPIGCTFSEKNRVEIMIHRKFGNNDYKGMVSTQVQDHVTSISFQFYIHSSQDMNDFWEQKIMGNVRVNEPIGIFEVDMSKADQSHKWPRAMQLFSNKIDIEKLHKHIEVADLKFMRHNLLKDVKRFELVMILRNRLGENIPFKADLSGSLTVFKNTYIDTLKRGRSSRFINGCNSNWDVLPNDKYHLKTLESEYQPSGKENIDEFTLKPYEMSEYRILNTRTYDRLKAEVNRLEESGINKISCKPLNLLKNPYKEPTSMSAVKKLILVLIMTTTIIVLFVSCRLYMKSNRKEIPYEIEMDVNPAASQESSEISDRSI
ncbi:unnamed protein product [Moneuplotes crassus]|uniref:Alpha-mannosidase n=1 Tax=Euplotes crassus TaxID=5936 RepID=A0AAD2D173_EUPCR|nr:unnamed protein product [Moneuplotes crassus]